MASKSVLAAGVAIGFGIKWAAPYFTPVLGALISPLARLQVKPLAVASVKAGWIGLERSREFCAYLAETMQDVLAEAKDELVQADRSSSAMDRT